MTRTTTTASPRTSFWRAEYHSRNFAFEAFGTTRKKALDALRALLATHAAQYRMTPTWEEDPDQPPGPNNGRRVWWPDLVMAEVIADDMVCELHMGAGYRDGELVS